MNGAAMVRLGLLRGLALGCFVAASCADPVPPLRSTAATDLPGDVSQFVPEASTTAPLAAMQTVALDSTLVRPVAYQSTVYRWGEDPRLAVTATLVTLESPTSARAAYNGWLARYGFMPAVERFAANVGDQAQRMQLGWPPVHVLIARSGNQFLLVDADARLPSQVGEWALLDIAGRTLSAAQPGPSPN